MTLLPRLVPGIYLYGSRSDRKWQVEKIGAVNLTMFLRFKRLRTGEFVCQSFSPVELKSHFELLTAKHIVFQAKPIIISLIANINRLHRIYSFSRLFATVIPLSDLLLHQLVITYNNLYCRSNTTEPSTYILNLSCLPSS